MFHPIQVRLAFGKDAVGSALYHLFDVTDHEVTLRPLNGGDDEVWVAGDPERLAEVLSRDLAMAPNIDLPIVVGNREHRLLAFAFGIRRCPVALAVIPVLDMADWLLLAAGKTQPWFILMDADRVEPN